MHKKLLIFIPSIEGGGVEKNLFIISNYLKDKINNISVITISNKFKNRFNRKIKFISPKAKFWDSIGRKKKFFLSLFLLFIEILKDRNILVFCFQGNVYCTLLCKLFGVKIIIRSNSMLGLDHKMVKELFHFNLMLVKLMLFLLVLVLT